MRTLVLFASWEHRPYDDHVARRGSQTVDKGAENRNGHVGGETAAAAFSPGTLAQLHGQTAACWEGAGHTAAVVKDLTKKQKQGLTQNIYSVLFKEKRRNLIEH